MTAEETVDAGANWVVVDFMADRHPQWAVRRILALKYKQRSVIYALTTVNDMCGGRTDDGIASRDRMNSTQITQRSQVRYSSPSSRACFVGGVVRCVVIEYYIYGEGAAYNIPHYRTDVSAI